MFFYKNSILKDMHTVYGPKAKADFYKMIDWALMEPVKICTKKGTVVMVSEDEWEGMMETIYLMGVPGLMEDIEEGRTMPKSELIRWNGGIG